MRYALRGTTDVAVACIPLCVLLRTPADGRFGTWQNAGRNRRTQELGRRDAVDSGGPLRGMQPARLFSLEFRP
jgi:hypothetical protein